MSARVEDIRNTIWADLDEVLSNDAILLYIWSWTNERCGAAGFYRCPRRFLLEGRLSEDRLDAALEECERAGKLRYEDGYLWSITRLRRLGWKTPQAEKAIRRELEELGPDNPIYGEFVAMYDGLAWGRDGKGQLTLSQGSAKGRLRVGQGSDAPGMNGSREPNSPGVSQGLARGRPGDIGKGNGIGKGKGKGSSGSGSTARVGSVDAAPGHIRDALPAVMEILGRVSETRGVPFEDPPRICAAMITYPAADHVAVASDMEDWLCNGARGRGHDVKDLIQTYRNQLARKQSSSPSAPKPGRDRTAYDEVVEPAA